MFELLKGMIKEEWRLHTSLYSKWLFLLSPVIMLVLAFVMSLQIPVIGKIISPNILSLIAHYSILIYGIMVGSFGLLGREFFERRFGEIGFLMSSFQTLPMSFRQVFTTFAIKDIIFYFFLAVMPVWLGFTAASFFIHASLYAIFTLLLTVSLSFLLGLSFSFFLSALYSWSGKLVLIVIALMMAAYSYGSMFMLDFYSFPFVPSILAIAVLSALSIALVKNEYHTKARRIKSAFAGLCHKFRVSGESHFIAKDFIDIDRSPAGYAKIFFSFLLPAALIWALISFASGFFYFHPAFILIFISLIIGTLATSIYNWLNEFDIVGDYFFLPVKIKDIIKAKTEAYLLLGIPSLFAATLLLSYIENMTGLFHAAFLTALIAFVYVGSLTVYLSGLTPHLLFNAKILLRYIAYSVPLLLAIIISSFLLADKIHLFLIFTAFLYFILIPVSAYLVKRGCDRWEKYYFQ